MKYLYNNKFILGILFPILILMGCRKFITIDSPVTQLVTATVFGDNTSATSAQTVIYSQMNNESYSMSWNSGLLGDELINYSSSIAQLQFYINAMAAFNDPGPWINAYNYIYQANAIIEGLKSNSRVSDIVKRQLMGESEFIRAFWHFYLTNCYGDIPLITSTDYTVNAIIARTPRVQVYQQIITDLRDAQNKLSDDYVDFSDTAITLERVRPTKWAAASLLARTYLYAKKYDSAELLATSVINNVNLYGLEPDLNNVFLANSKEAIWQLQTPLPTILNTFDGYYFILLAEPTTDGSSVSSQLLNSFEPGDNRRSDWLHDTSFAGNSYSYPYKYKVQASSTVTEYVMVLRLAEQYLIRSEARAQQGKTSDALADLNTIRKRAGLLDYMGATDKTSLLAAILHERQVELFTEWGHRWFDLIRTGNINAVMNIVSPLKGGTWNADGHQLVYPIPQTEIVKDHNLIQNAGYF